MPAIASFTFSKKILSHSVFLIYAHIWANRKTHVLLPSFPLQFLVCVSREITLHGNDVINIDENSAHALKHLLLLTLPHRPSHHSLSRDPDRGRSPLEWVDFPYVHPSVCPYVRTSSPLGHPSRSEAQLARPEAQPARPEAQPAKPEA